MLQTLSRFFSIKKVVACSGAAGCHHRRHPLFAPERKRSRPQSSVLRPFRRHQLHRAAATRRFSRPVALSQSFIGGIFSAILLSSFPRRL